MVYKGPERRITQNHDCPYHGELAEAITTLKGDKRDTKKDQIKIFTSLESKVSYANFKWAFGITIGLILAVTTLNWNSSNKMVDSNNAMSRELIEVKAEIKGTKSEIRVTNIRLDGIEQEQKHFRKMSELFIAHVIEATPNPLSGFDFRAPNGAPNNVD